MNDFIKYSLLVYFFGACTMQKNELNIDHKHRTEIENVELRYADTTGIYLVSMEYVFDSINSIEKLTSVKETYSDGHTVDINMSKKCLTLPCQGGEYLAKTYLNNSYLFNNISLKSFAYDMGVDSFKIFINFKVDNYYHFEFSEVELENIYMYVMSQSGSK